MKEEENRGEERKREIQRDESRGSEEEREEIDRKRKESDPGRWIETQ